MSARRIISVVAISLFALAASAVLVVLSLDLNSFRPRIAATLSNALGRDITIEGLKRHCLICNERLYKILDIRDYLDLADTFEAWRRFESVEHLVKECLTHLDERSDRDWVRPAWARNRR